MRFTFLFFFNNLFARFSDKRPIANDMLNAHSDIALLFRPLMGEKSQRSLCPCCASQLSFEKHFSSCICISRHCIVLLFGLFPLQLQHVMRSGSLVIGHSGEHCCIAPRKASSLTLPRLGKSAGFELDGTRVIHKFANISSSVSSRTINNFLQARTAAVPLTRQS